MARFGSGRDRVDAFDAEVATVVKAVFPLALLLCRDRVEAEDALAESVVKCLDRWRSGRIESPRAYLRRALVNEVRTRHRRTRGMSVTPLGVRGVEDAASRQGFATIDVRDTIVQALRSVPERQRIAVVLRYFEDLALSDIAELMGTSQGTAKSQVSRGLARLREVLAQDNAKEQTDG